MEVPELFIICVWAPVAVDLFAAVARVNSKRDQ